MSQPIEEGEQLIAVPARILQIVDNVLSNELQGVRAVYVDSPETEEWLIEYRSELVTLLEFLRSHGMAQASSEVSQWLETGPELLDRDNPPEPPTGADP